MKCGDRLNKLALQFNTFNFAEDNEHINKMPYSGICLLADTPSDGTPCGADKPVAFSKEAIEKALDTFVGMGVNCVYWEYGCPEYALTGHDTRFKIGVVDEATLVDGGVHIKGNLWKNDFNDVCFQIKNAKDSLGFSVEVCVNDMEETSDFYLVKDFTFTGVAILYKNLAAFKNTQLAAQRKKESDDAMTEEQMNKLLDFATKLENTLSSIDTRLAALETKEEKEIDFSEVVNAVNGLGEKIEAKAEPTPAPTPEPKTKISFVGKLTDEDKLALSEKCAEIDKDASITPDRKAKAKIDAFKASLKTKE